MNIAGTVVALIAILIFAGAVPFLLGILIQIAVRGRDLPDGVHYGIAAVLVVGAWLALDRTPVVVADTVWLSILISIGFVGLCLQTGFRSAASFRSGMDEGRRGDMDDDAG